MAGADDKIPPSPIAAATRDAEELSHNLARLVEELGRAASAYLRPREEGRRPFADPSSLNEVVGTLSQLGEYWRSRPEDAAAAQQRLWQGYFDLWTWSVKKLMGEDAAPVAVPDPRDRRFRDKGWNDSQFHAFLMQLYLISSRWAGEMVEGATELDPHVRRKADFYVRQIAAALAPTNFVATNPELLRATIQSKGENLVRGMHMLAEDIAAGGGDLRLRQTDMTKFELGRNLASTPGKVVHRNALREVIQYSPTTDTVLRRPLLIVPPWINKFYILDLGPEKSFIRWAVAQGHTVFVVSWVNPDAALAGKDFGDYLREGLIEALDVVGQATGAKEVNAIGYCVGGTLLATALGYLAAKGDRRIASATFFASQVDFTHGGDLKVFIDESQVAALERRMKQAGFLEGREMASTFNALRPNDLIWPYVINNYFLGREPPPFDLLYWNADSTRMPPANHSFYLRRCYMENRLARGELTIDGERVDLSASTVPVYTVAPREDHISPAASVYVGAKAFGGPVTFILAGSGHIAGIINPPDPPKYQFWTDGDPKAPTVEAWLASAVEHPGSWWPHWQAWIEGMDARRVKARRPGGTRLKPIEDAPGSYVRVRA